MERSKVHDELLKEQLDDDMSLYAKRIKACDAELAIIAVANKLLRQAFAIMKSSSAYDPAI